MCSPVRAVLFVSFQQLLKQSNTVCIVITLMNIINFSMPVKWKQLNVKIYKSNDLYQEYRSVIAHQCNKDRPILFMPV